MEYWQLSNAMYAMSCMLTAYAEINGMTAENMQRQALGQSMAYTEKDFNGALHRNSADWNSIVTQMQGGSIGV